jgi:hypothetical protein
MKREAAGMANALLIRQTVPDEKILRDAFNPRLIENAMSFQLLIL